MECVIGALEINPSNVSPETGEYVVEFPQGTRVLCTEWTGAAFVLWVAVPTALVGEKHPVIKRRFWILPGLRKVTLPYRATYVGTVIVPYEADALDWHVFADYTSLPVEGPAQATYQMH